MTDTNDTAASLPAAPRQDDLKLRRTAAMAAIFVTGLALGGGALLALSHHQNTFSAAPLPPTTVASLQTSRAIAAKGEVAEIFGNKFILQDATGRALVDTGRAGEGGHLVAKGEKVDVEGSFDDGVMHAAALTHGDGKRVVIGPLGGPPGPLERLGDRIGLWPDADVDALTKRVQSAGYEDVRVAGRGPRHLDVVAKSKDGKDHDLHVDFDGRIEDRSAL